MSAASLSGHKSDVRAYPAPIVNRPLQGSTASSIFKDSYRSPVSKALQRPATDNRAAVLLLENRPCGN